MNWYKLSQNYQPELFSEDILNNLGTFPHKEEEQYLNYSGKMKDDIEDAENFDQCEKIAKYYGYNYDRIKLEDDSEILTIFKGKEFYIIEDEGFITLENAQEWIDNLTDWQVENYVIPEDYQLENDNIWKQISGDFFVYHGTYEDKVDNINKNGIKAKSESRGISNRDIGDAVFVSEDADVAFEHYPRVFQINIGKMKQDGYMPRISRETPLERSEIRQSLANKIGFYDYREEEYYSEGYDYGTMVIYGDIPKKYIKLI